MAHFTISSGDLFRNPALAWEIWSAVMCSIRLPGQKDAVAPVAEAFSGISFLHETYEHRAQFVFDIRIFHHIFPNAIESCAGNVATEPDLITSRSFADERNLRHVRPRAAVWAAGRADDDLLAAKSEVAAKFFEPVNETGQHAFRFREREATSGQSRA